MKPARGPGLRITGGAWRGRRLAVPPGHDLRPTAERTRQALFNILAHRPDLATAAGPLPEGIAVLDAFAGTGALGIEALSRGAAHATFVERDPAAAARLGRALRQLGADERVSILCSDVLAPGPAARRFPLVLMDAPYDAGLSAPAVAALDAAGWLAPGAILTIELAAAETFAPPPGFAVLDERRYGTARLVLLKAPG